MMIAEVIKKELRIIARKDKVSVLSKFFKTGPGQYGEGDVFIGVTVPEQRTIARKFVHADMKDIATLLASEVHEHRMTGLLILVEKFKKSDDLIRGKIVDFYMRRASRINNWDLVDLSAPKITGPWFLSREKTPLYEFARSGSLWKERIAIVSTYHFIKNGILEHTFAMADILMEHEHDLIHKAVGWMLREAGKSDRTALEGFLNVRYRKMPRTMLRYSIEKFERRERDLYLSGKA